MFKLKDYQVETVEYGLKNPYCLYALKQGLGKTLCALATANKLDLPLLVVCPSYLKSNWKEEIEKFFPEKTAVVIRTKKDIHRPFDCDVVIVSYSLVHLAEILFKWARMVACDEAHYLKEMDSRRTKSVHKFVYENSIERLLLLTGTPIQNRVYEFYSLLCLIYYNPKLNKPLFLRKFPKYTRFADFFSYRQQYEITVNGRRRKIVKWDGVRNIEKLKYYLQDCYIRFDESVLDTKESIYKDVPVDSMKDNKDLLAHFKNWTEENDSVQSEVKAKAALETAKFTVNYVKDLLESEDKVVVYSDHVEATKFIAEKLGVPPITGNTTQKKRDKLRREFQDGELRCIAATIPAFSTGITLTAANNMVFNDFPWVPGELEQAEFRINRIGQTKACIYHRIIGSPQSRYILNTLEKKKETISRVI